MLNLFVFIFIGSFAVTTAALAHGLTAEADGPGDALLIRQYVVVVAAVVAYAAGVYRIRREVGAGRIIERSQSLAFAVALSVVVIILSPPIDRLTDTFFSAHMAQHLLLMLVVAPLIVWSRPVLVMLWALPRGRRVAFAKSGFARSIKAIADFLMHPLIVAGLFLGIFSFWHLPGPYRWAQSNEWLHAGEHVSFLVSAIMFWTLVVEPSGRRRMTHMATLLYVAAIAAVSGLPGALMLLSPIALFQGNGAASAFGLTALEDQQIAGLIMWVPAGVCFLAPIVWLFFRAIEEPSRFVGRLRVTPVAMRRPAVCTGRMGREEPRKIRGRFHHK
jgi:cytochrome c oxidase assembly factor CtaG